MPINSFISWVGGKKALRKIIYPLFPVGYERYIEVFGGGGWVLFGMEADSKIMEVYNDFNGDLVNLFACVRERPLALIKELNCFPLNSRQEFSILKQALEKGDFDSKHLKEEMELAERMLSPPCAAEIRDILSQNACLIDVKRAATFYKLIRYSYGSGCTSFGSQPFDIRKTFSLIWEASYRLKDTVIENKDFEGLIRQYDREKAFFYCDPPYYETEGHYAVVFEKSDHIRLRDTLAASAGKWMVSYNDCEYIRELYDGFHILAFTRINNLAQRYKGGSEFPELIITNYDPWERGKSAKQLDFFSSLCRPEEQEEEYYAPAN